MKSRFIIHCREIIDGTGETLPAATAVAVEGDRITAVGRYEDVAGMVPPGTATLEYSNCSAIPGLINMHDHSFFRRAPKHVGPLPVPVQAMFGASSALFSLSEGVTVIRDMGSNATLTEDLREAIRCGVVPGPRVFTPIKPLTRPGGPGAGLSIAVEGVDQVARAVESLLEHRPDFVKVFVSSDGSAPNQPLLGFSEVKETVRLARSAGLKVIAHAVGKDDVAMCIRAGVAGIDHGAYVNDEVAREMSLSDVFFVPTMSGFSELALNGCTWGRSAHQIQQFKEHVKVHAAAVRAAVDTGVRLGVGTDSLGLMVDEIKMMHAAGVPVRQLIKAATLESAKFLGIHETTGRIMPGYLADIALLRTSPVENLDAFDLPVRVFVAGKQYDPSMLRSIYPR